MLQFDVSFADPAMNLAVDEALLDEAESGRLGDSLRFWESPSPFVVLGLAQRVSEEVNTDEAEGDGVPVLRRCSAGGCVVQGPGCLNFSLVLEHHDHDELRTIRASYAHILGKVCNALSELGLHAEPQGISDIALGGLKFSGNAQRRRKRFLLHHGTVLYGFDIGACVHYVREPTLRPEYRGTRPHTEFLRNIDATRDGLVDKIGREFCPASMISESIPEHVMSRAEGYSVQKYKKREWNYRK